MLIKTTEKNSIEQEYKNMNNLDKTKTSNENTD